MKDYLEQLRKEAGKTHVSPGSLAKIAGLKMPDSMCSECGAEMVKTGALQRCSCGFVKKAEDPLRPIPPQMQVPEESGLDLPPAEDIADEGVGDEMEGKMPEGMPGGDPAGGMIGGSPGLAGGGIGDVLMRVMQARQQRAGEVAESGIMPSEKIASLVKRAIEEQKKEKGDLYVPMGRGLPGFSTPSARTLIPFKSSQLNRRFDLVPSLKVSPAVGATPTGLSWGILIKRRCSGVPSDSLVGEGLDHQRPGASVEAREKDPPKGSSGK